MILRYQGISNPPHPPRPSDALPAAAARPAEFAAGQADELARLAEQAARRYAIAALTVFNAAVAGASPARGT